MLPVTGWIPRAGCCNRKKLREFTFLVAMQSCPSNVWEDHGLHSWMEIAKQFSGSSGTWCWANLHCQTIPNRQSIKTFHVVNCPPKNILISSKAGVAKPNKIAGKMTASNNIKRKCKAMCAFVETNLCLWKNYSQFGICVAVRQSHDASYVGKCAAEVLVFPRPKTRLTNHRNHQCPKDVPTCPSLANSFLGLSKHPPSSYVFILTSVPVSLMQDSPISEFEKMYGPKGMHFSRCWVLGPTWKGLSLLFHFVLEVIVWFVWN